MNKTLSTPTQDTSASHSFPRCEHGYYVESRELHTPRCPMCDPIQEPWTKEEVKVLLRRRAMSQVVNRKRTIAGRFERLYPVPEGEQRCWCCGDTFPADHDHFRRAASKTSGLQTRCKKCDNKRKTIRRREFAGVEA
jgi:Zn finger protein HypA/HybF involved in hydrogenase expression